MVVEDFYHRICLKCFGYRSPNKEARDMCWDVLMTLLVCIFDELRAVQVVAEDAFNNPDRANEIYLWSVL